MSVSPRSCRHATGHAFRSWAGRLTPVLLLAAVAACSVNLSPVVRNGVAYVKFHDALVYMLFVGGAARERPNEQRQALASTSYTFGYGTPFLPFTGNRSVVVGPLSADRTIVATATLQRAADCSLTETVYQPVNGALDITSFVDLPNAQDELHRLAGLATQPDLFPRGCSDTTRGKRSVFTAMPLTVTATTLRFADLNPTSEQLEVYNVNRATGAKTITALTPGRVKSFLVVDINGDGLPDVVASGVGYGAGDNGNVAVFLANADGTFRSATSFPNGGSIFTIEDLNGDGKLDLVIDNGYDANGSSIPGVTTMLGNGDGTFRAAVVSPTTVAGVPGPFVTGDFNGDGRPDLLLGTEVLLGNGDGTFRVGPTLPAGVANSLSFYGAVGDLDRDGPGRRGLQRLRLRAGPARQRRRQLPDRGTLRVVRPVDAGRGQRTRRRRQPRHLRRQREPGHLRRNLRRRAAGPALPVPARARRRGHSSPRPCTRAATARTRRHRSSRRPTSTATARPTRW